MTDMTDAETLKVLLDTATPGPWQRLDGMAAATVCSASSYDEFMRGNASELHFIHDAGAACPMAQANARLIALAPSLAARVIEQDARIARLTEALRLHQAWSDSEGAGPDYGAQTRDTHPDGERIWRQWWDGNLDLCARAQEATRAVLEDGQ